MEKNTVACSISIIDETFLLAYRVSLTICLFKDAFVQNINSKYSTHNYVYSRNK